MLDMLTRLINLQGEDTVHDSSQALFGHRTLLAKSQCNDKISQPLLTCFLLSNELFVE